MHNNSNTHISRIKKVLRTPRFAIIGIWLFASAFNINKAYHIDDTFYLEASQWIAKNPLHPMQGMVNWSSASQPIFKETPPALFPYILALWGSVFSYHEISIHFLISLIALLCIWITYKISLQLYPTHALIITAIVCLSPGFVVGQNVMLTIPLLALHLLFYWVLLTPANKKEHHRWIVAGIIAGIAVLIKYSSLPLLPVLLFFILWKKQFKYLWSILIPITAIILWSLFNLWDYGDIHIVNGPHAEKITMSKLWNGIVRYLLIFGAIVPAIPVLILSMNRSLFQIQWIRFTLKSWAVVLMTVFTILVAAFYTGLVGEPLSEPVLKYLFLANALVAVLALILAIAGEISIHKKISDKVFLLCLWILSNAGFIVLFAGFHAPRHVLPVVPPAILLLFSGIDKLKGTVKIPAIAISCILTIMLASADWYYADYYRRSARHLKEKVLPKDQKIYFSGHWGWQWYAKKQGFEQIEFDGREYPEESILLYPLLIHQQFSFPYTPKTPPVQDIQKPPFWNYFSTADMARFYVEFNGRIPWTLSRRPYPPILVIPGGQKRRR